ncbi:MAG: hypothetical protein E7137_07850 [Rikenellaceae bacterium]|nr:hypothetical protein [Rikenellaceae bacterium]
MKRLLFVALVLLLGGCGSKEPALFTGTFTEAELNTVTIAPEQGAAVTFSTDEAELIGFEELLPGAPVKVTYIGRLRKGEPTPAQRVEVNPVYARLVGRWIETGEGADEYGMGFELLPADPEKRDRRSRNAPNAHSIGMNTLVFRQWRLLPDGRLWLAGHSLGNGSTISFGEEWEIKELESDRLVIAQPDITLHLRRESPKDVERRLEREAADAHPSRVQKTKK